MKKILLIFVILCLYVPSFAGKAYKATSIEIIGDWNSNNFDGFGYNCQAAYDNKTYIYSQDPKYSFIRETVVDIYSDNSIKLIQNKNLYQDMDESISAGYPLAACTFKNRIYLFTHNDYMSSKKVTYYHKAPNPPGNSESHFNQTGQILDCETDLPCDAIVFNDKMFFFYIERNTGTILYRYTEDGNNWSSKCLLVCGNYDKPPNPNSGNISVCNITDNDRKSCIFLAYVSKNHEICFGYFKGLDDPHDLRNQHSFNDDEVIKIDCIQGSTKDGKTGNIVQIFYTTSKKDVYNNQNYFKRVEYDIENEYYNDYKATQYSQAENNITQSTWQPLLLSDFVTVDSGHMQKKIAVMLQRIDENFNLKPYGYNYDYDLNFDFLTWDSEIFVYDPSDDTYDSKTDSSLWQIVGVIEGPPPYILNGWSLTQDNSDENMLPSTERPVSKLSYGIMNQSTNKKESSFSMKSKVEMNFRGFLFGGGTFFENESTEENEITVTVNFELEPVDEEALGYYLMLKPTIYRKKYNILDAKGNVIDDFYIFKVSDNHLSLIPFNMADGSSALNPYNIETYLARTYPLNQYTQIFKHAFSASLGSAETITYDIKDTKSSNRTRSVNFKFGVDKEFPEIFKIETTEKLEWNWTTEVSSTSGQEVEIYTDLPEDNPHINLTHDTTAYDGNFYWIAHTDGQDNWWVPKGSIFSNQQPWCMTWEVTNIDSRAKGVMLSTVDNIGFSGFNMYPNPANDLITLNFELMNNARTIVSLYNLNGELVSVISDKFMNKGEQSLEYNIMSLSSGLYKCVIQNAGDIRVKKLAIVK